jgi:hypothetical protein
MSKYADLVLSATIPSNQPTYRELVGLEIESSFSFQSGMWLGDIAPDLLTGDMYEMLMVAKQKATQRERIESRIPKHMLYVKGWPIAVPSFSEAEMLYEVRRTVTELLGLGINYTDPISIIERYNELMAAKPAE